MNKVEAEEQLAEQPGAGDFAPQRLGGRISGHKV